MSKQSQKPIVLVKIGGSLITDKHVPNSVRQTALEKIVHEIFRATQLGQRLIIGHGAGSFAHVPAHKYQTHKGLVNAKSIWGIAEVAHAARRLNLIVMEALLQQKVPAVAVSPLSIFQAREFALDTVNTDAIEQLLALEMVPVVYGDQILDVARGCTIFSTERVLGYLGEELQRKTYQVERIIHCGQTNGVYDASGNTIPHITRATYAEFADAVTGSDGIDVTGGMVHKVQEALNLAEHGIPGLIIDGIEHGSLSQAIAGEPVVGTAITTE